MAMRNRIFRPLLALALTLTACGTVDEGHRGVKLVWGAAQGSALSPGLHTYNPLSTDIDEVDIREKKFQEPTMAATKDQQMVNTTVAVNYSANPESVVEIYSTLGRTPEVWENTIVSPHIQEVLKSVTADYTALELITKRSEVKERITQELTERIHVSNFLVKQVSITDFQFSAAYMAAIEAKQVAEQKAQQAQNELEQNALEVQKITQKAEADKAAAIAQAQGKAESLRINAKAVADWHHEVSKATTNGSLRYAEIQKWNGITPQYVGDAGVLLPGK